MLSRGGGFFVCIKCGALRCDACGEEFFVGHNPASVDKWVAEKQAKWLEKILSEEHERDKKHQD